MLFNSEKTMTTVATPLFTTWHWFWEEVEKAESPWYRSLDEDGRNAVEMTIETMLRASIPTKALDHLRELWSALPHTSRSIREDVTLRWNIGGIVKGPDDSTDMELNSFMVELVQFDSLSEKQLMESVSHFIRVLKQIVLATLWTFATEWCCYTSMIPRQPVQLLHTYLFEVAAIVLLSELS